MFQSKARASCGSSEVPLRPGAVTWPDSFCSGEAGNGDEHIDEGCEPNRAKHPTRCHTRQTWRGWSCQPGIWMPGDPNATTQASSQPPPMRPSLTRGARDQAIGQGCGQQELPAYVWARCMRDGRLGRFGRPRGTHLHSGSVRNALFPVPLVDFVWLSPGLCPRASGTRMPLSPFTGPAGGPHRNAVLQVGAGIGVFGDNRAGRRFGPRCDRSLFPENPCPPSA